MKKINKKAQAVINRIAKIAQNYGNVWNEKGVIAKMKECYTELGVPIPEKVEIGDLLFGFAGFSCG